ncbi:MAG: hypothetical protein ACTSQH_09870 [Candidatus Hodarchaeales archaeon]
MARAEEYNEMSNKVFLRNVGVQYWYFVLIFGLIIIGAIIGFILTLNEYIDISTIGGQGTWSFDQFSMGTGIEWIIFLFLWLLVIVGVPALVITGIIVAVIWYKYVALDGNWMTEFGNLSLRYFVNAWLTVFLWFIAICSIGIAIGIVWFVKKYES